MVSFGFKRSCPLAGITQRHLPRAPAPIEVGRHYETGGAPFRREVGRHYDPGRNRAPVPVETVPHLRRNRAPSFVEISAPLRPESAMSPDCQRFRYRVVVEVTLDDRP